MKKKNDEKQLKRTTIDKNLQKNFVPPISAHNSAKPTARHIADRCAHTIDSALNHALCPSTIRTADGFSKLFVKQTDLQQIFKLELNKLSDALRIYLISYKTSSSSTAVSAQSMDSLDSSFPGLRRCVGVEQDFFTEISAAPIEKIV